MKELLLPAIFSSLALAAVFGFWNLYKLFRLSFEKGLKRSFYFILVSFVCGMLMMCIAIAML